MQNPQNQLDDNGIPDFEPVGFYDAPSTILTQIWDGEGSLGRAIRTVAHSESLSPKERDSYATRLKKAYGGNAVVDTAIDVATNPFTWLLLAVTPFGAKQFAAARGRLFQGQAAARARGQRVFPFVSELARMLKMSNLLNMGETVAPSMLAQIIGSRWDSLSRLESQVVGRSGRTMAQVRKGLMDKLGVDDLDWTRHAEGSAKQKLLREVDVMSHLYATGSLSGGQVPYAETYRTRGGTFKPVTEGNVAAESVPLLVPEADYRKMVADLKGTVRPGDRVVINGAEYEVGEHGIIEVIENADLKKLRKLFPRGEREGINYRQQELVPQNLMSVQGVNNEFFQAWAESHGIHAELLEYLDTGRILREEMKKRLFYKVDAAGNPLPGGELDVDKIVNMWTKWQKTRTKGADLSPHEWAMSSLLPMEEVDQILSQTAKQAARRGSTAGITEENVKALIREKIEPLLRHPYLPRNNFTVYKKDASAAGGLRPMGPAHSDALLRGRESISTPQGIKSMVLPRRGEAIPWDPNDFTLIRELAIRQGLNPAELAVTFPHFSGEGLTLENVAARMTKKIDTSATAGNEHAVTHSMGYEMNMRTYMRDSMGMVILHGSQIPESQYVMLQEALKSKSAQMRAAYKSGPLPGTALTARQRKELGLPEDLEITGELTWTLPETLATHPEAAATRGDLIRAQEELRGLSIATSTPATERRKGLVERKVKALQNKLGRLGRMKAMPAETLLAGARPYMTLDDAIETVMRTESPEVQEYFKRIVLPGFFGGANPTMATQLRISQGARNAARTMADSAAGRWLERNGGSLGEAVVRNMRDYSNMTGYNLDALHASGGLTGYLYATHLGFNTVSAMWNLLQPMQWAMTWMGGEHILKGYASAFKQLGSYYAERVGKYGLGRISAQDQMALWQKHIRLAGRDSAGRDLLGMGHDALSTIEGASFMRKPEGTPSLGKWLLIDTPLALFQSAEAINRITVAEATMGWLRQLQEHSGIRLAANEVLDYAQLMQSMSNFNYNPITQLQMFQKGGPLGNAMLRMFLQYPSRTMANMLMSTQLGEGTRSFGLQRVGGPSVEIPAFIGDMSRLLGIGAVTYEIGKNLFNVNLSSGLAGSALTQLPSQFMSGKYPIPPVIDIPAQLIGSLADQDRDQFRQAAFRLLPGGLAIQKALGALPALPGGGNFGIVQSQYADWSNQNPEGQVPVYDSNGMLQGFESPLTLVMKGVGADFKRYKSPQEATKFLLANRSEMVDLRRKYKDAVLGNNMAAAQGIEAEYKKRYGVPMTVKPGEWDRAVSMRETTVSERMLDTMPAEVRGMYQQALSGPRYAQAMGLPAGALEQGETASQRASIRQFNAPVQNPADTTD